MFVKKIFLALCAVLKVELILPSESATPHHLSLHSAARSRYAFMFTDDRNLVKLVKNLLYFKFPTEVFDKTCVPIFFFNKSLYMVLIQ